MASPLLNFEIPPDTFYALERELTPDQLRRALYTIVTRTQSKVVTSIGRGVHDENPFIKKKYLKRVVSKIKPQGNPPVGAVVVKNERLPLIAFKVKGFKGGPGTHGGTITIAKDLSPIVLRHAFLASVKAGADSEHTGIFLRAKGIPSSVVKNRDGHARKYTPEGFAERLPIEQQFGPGIFNIVVIPEVLKRIEIDTTAEMQKQAASRLDFYLDHDRAAATAADQDSTD